jgi:hypothetical protein
MSSGCMVAVGPFVAHFSFWDSNRLISKSVRPLVTIL